MQTNVEDVWKHGIEKENSQSWLIPVVPCTVYLYIKNIKLIWLKWISSSLLKIIPGLCFIPLFLLGCELKCAILAVTFNSAVWEEVLSDGFTDISNIYFSSVITSQMRENTRMNGTICYKRDSDDKRGNFSRKIVTVRLKRQALSKMRNLLQKLWSSIAQNSASKLTSPAASFPNMECRVGNQWQLTRCYLNAPILYKNFLFVDKYFDLIGMHYLTIWLG